MDYLLNTYEGEYFDVDFLEVLNLIINGLPSKLYLEYHFYHKDGSFKPYYKWITF